MIDYQFSLKKSKHLSVGTFAVTSLMVFSTVNKLEGELTDQYLMAQKNASLKIDSFTHDYFHHSNETMLHTMPDPQTIKLRIATSLAFWCGIIQVLFSFLRLGNVSKYLSQPLLRG